MCNETRKSHSHTEQRYDGDSTISIRKSIFCISEPMLIFSQSNEDTWADKIKYHIYIPSRYYAFGTSIPVQFTLLPLRKGVRIGKIKMEVLEHVGLETNRQGELAQATTLPDKTVASMEQLVPTESSQL